VLPNREPSPNPRRYTAMNRLKTTIAAFAITGAALGGGALGATLFAPSGASAQTSSTTASASDSTTATPAPGTFHPNEDSAHEAGESAAREAQEDAGQVPTVP
jgi:hypothetical protein